MELFQLIFAFTFVMAWTYEVDFTAEQSQTVGQVVAAMWNNEDVSERALLESMPARMRIILASKTPVQTRKLMQTIFARQLFGPALEARRRGAFSDDVRLVLTMGSLLAVATPSASRTAPPIAYAPPRAPGSMSFSESMSYQPPIRTQEVLAPYNNTGRGSPPRRYESSGSTPYRNPNIGLIDSIGNRPYSYSSH